APDAGPQHGTPPNATADLFPLLGVTPALGRTFAPDEDQPGHSHFALLSYSLWRSQFGADPNAISKSIQLDRDTYIIVGVLPKQFSLGGKQDLWLPLALNRTNPGNRRSQCLHVVARLKSDVQIAQASSALTRLADDLRRAYPDNYNPSAPDDFGMFLMPVKEQLVGKLRPALLVLLGA